MATTRIATAGKIINRAALEIGLPPQADPFASEDASFQQLVALLNTAGEELATAFQWEQLTRSYQFTTTALDTGDYDLPSDFLYMIPQSG